MRSHLTRFYTQPQLEMFFSTLFSTKWLITLTPSSSLIPPLSTPSWFLLFTLILCAKIKLFLIFTLLNPLLPSQASTTWDARYVSHGLLLEKRQSPQAREIQLCVNKYNEQPPTWQTLGMAFTIFGFHCFHFHLCWLFTIKLSSHFAYIYVTSAQLSSARISSFLHSSLWVYSPTFFFPLYLYLCLLIIFKKKFSPRNWSILLFISGKRN